MTQSITVADLLAPHQNAFEDRKLFSGVSVVSAHTLEGTMITSTTRYIGAVNGSVESQWTYNDGDLTTPEFGSTVDAGLHATTTALAQIIAGIKND